MDVGTGRDLSLHFQSSQGDKTRKKSGIESEYKRPFNFR